MTQDWKRFLNQRDRDVLQALGFGARMGFGQRPALVIIDTNYEFCGEGPLPILESIRRWRGSCGEEGWAAVAVMKRLIAAAHAKDIVPSRDVLTPAHEWSRSFTGLAECLT